MSYFDEYASRYETALGYGLALAGEDSDYFAKGRVKLLATELSKIEFSPAVILDYGCGTGGSIGHIRQVFKPDAVIGFDISDRSLAIARVASEDGRDKFTSTLGTIPANSVDLVFSNGTFHHIVPREFSQHFSAIRERLRAGGIFALWENNPWSLAARVVMSRIEFDHDAVMVNPRRAGALLESVGFEVFHRSFHFLFPRALAKLRRIEPFLSRFPLGAQYVLMARNTVTTRY